MERLWHFTQVLNSLNMLYNNYLISKCKRRQKKLIKRYKKSPWLTKSFKKLNSILSRRTSSILWGNCVPKHSSFWINNKLTHNPLEEEIKSRKCSNNAYKLKKKFKPKRKKTLQLEKTDLVLIDSELPTKVKLNRKFLKRNKIKIINTRWIKRCLDKSPVR